MTSHIRRATALDLPRAARTLAVAFHDYPWTRWSIPADDHPRRLEELQALYLGHALAHGLVLVTDDAQAVAAFLPGDAPAPGEGLQARIAELHGDRLAALMAVELPARPPGAWEFATLGVHPERRGIGLGSAVAAAGVTLIDESGDPNGIALETSDERNVRRYERLGFTVTARTTIEGGPLVCSMYRPARRTPVQG
ncbi:GNAT family N-acetyltransferase [Micromonospora sp. NPDC049257]|uniref:GNAT family N-acetyltransferase n=1 Tax=Micromonospora sp. NPDC049257 TaxID=3155771 RepID=UPI00342B943D